jgi:hypothetical protein
VLEDFDGDAIFIWQNGLYAFASTGSRRSGDCKIITFNPVLKPVQVEFTDPQVRWKYWAQHRPFAYVPAGSSGRRHCGADGPIAVRAGGERLPSGQRTSRACSTIIATDGLETFAASARHRRLDKLKPCRVWPLPAWRRPPRFIAADEAAHEKLPEHR